MGNTLTKLRKVVASFSIATLLASLVVVSPVAAATLPADFQSWGDDLEAAVDHGLLDENKLSTLGDHATKYEFAKIIAVAWDLEMAPEAATGFTDVPEWARGYVGAVVENEIAFGDSATVFSLNSSMPRGVAATMINRATNAHELYEGEELGAAWLAEFGPDQQWMIPEFEVAVEAGFFQGEGDGKLNPGGPLLKAAAGVVAARGAGLAPIPGVDNPESEGDLHVSLASSSPSGITIPSSATSVEVATWEFSADEDDVVVDGLTVHKFGVGELAAGFQAYLYAGDERLTSGKSLNSSTNELRFNNLDWTVPAGEEMEVSLVVEMGVNEAGEVGFELESVDAVDSNAASVSGSFPVRSALHGLSATEVGTVTVTRNGSITNPKVGEDDVTIAKFKVNASTEDAELRRLGLYLTGTVSTEAVENWELYVSGTTEPIATVAGVNSRDVATFVFSTPYLIEKGQTKNFEVRADFNTGRGSDTVGIYIDESTDVFAVGGTYGFGMAVDIGTSGTYDGADTGSDADTAICSSSTDNCTFSTLEGGDITISSNGPAATDIAINGEDVVLMDFNVTSVSEVTFKNFGISLTASESASTQGLLKEAGVANFTDIKVIEKESGRTVLGPVDATAFKNGSLTGTTIAEGTNDNAEAFYLFTDEIDFDAGESMDYQLVVDVENYPALDGMTLVAELQTSGSYPEIRDVNNKVVSNSTSLVPTSVITGKTMTVASPSVTVTKASVPTDDTYVKGSDEMSLLGISVRAGDASDTKITDMTVRFYADDGDGAGTADTFDNGEGDTAANAVIQNPELWVGDELVAGPENLTSNGTAIGTDGGYYYATFNDVDYDIEAGETVTFVVKADALNNLANTRWVAADIDADSDITAEDEDGNTITIATSSNLNNSTTPSPLVTVTQGGSLTIAVDPATAKEDIVVAGSSGVEVSKFRFTSTDEAFLVTKLSVNNRQSGVASGNIGDYDDNVTSVKLSYENKDGATVTKTGTLANGTAQFSGLDFYVPADDDATISVSANLNTESAGADMGTFVDFALAFNNFEAIAEGSGETYDAGELDATVASTSDLDIGSISFTNSGYDTNNDTEAVGNPGTTQTLTIDTGSSVFPVGTLLFVDDTADGTYTEGSESLFVVTSAWSTTVPTVKVANNGDVALAEDKDVYYALPGSGYFTETTHQHVYESKPTVSLSASSPSGSRTVNAVDQVFSFNIAANAMERVQIRAAVEENDTIVQGTDAGGDICVIATDTDAGDSVDGTAAKCTIQNDTAGDSFAWDATGTDLSGYARINFWIQVEGAAPEFADLRVWTTPDQDEGDLDTSETAGDSDFVALSQTACSADASTFATTEWYNCDIAMPTGTDSSDNFIQIEIHESTELGDGDIIYVDELKFYNEKLVVDVATDTDIDTYANNTTNAGAPVEAYLKEGSTTRATGYFSSVTNGASAAATASVAFIPTTAIEIAKGTSKTFSVETDTADLLAEDAGSDDPVTFSFDLGSSSNGSVTAGDFWWHETNATVKWLGEVSNTKFSGNTLLY